MNTELEPTLTAAMRVVARYGIARTTMADIAREAGVSRQTLYDRFGDKDGVMAAVIRHMCDQMCGQVTEAWAGAPDLSARLDAYIDIAVLPVFETLQTLPDAQDLVHGKGSAAAAATDEAVQRKRGLLAEMLRQTVPGLGGAQQRAEEIAEFFETATTAAKTTTADRAALDRFLATLKSATLALSTQR